MALRDLSARMGLPSPPCFEEVSTHLHEGCAPGREPPAHRYMYSAPPLRAPSYGDAPVAHVTREATPTATADPPETAVQLSGTAVHTSGTAVHTSPATTVRSPPVRQ